MLSQNQNNRNRARVCSGTGAFNPTQTSTSHSGTGAFNPTQTSTRNGTGAFNPTQTSTSHSGTGAFNPTQTSTRNGTGAFNPTQSSTRNGTGAFNQTQTSTSHSGTGAFNPTQSSTRNGTGAFNRTQTSTSHSGTGAFNRTRTSTSHSGTGAFNPTQSSTSCNGTGAFNPTQTSTSHNGTGAFNPTQTSTSHSGTGAFNPTQSSTRNGTGAFNRTQTSTSHSGTGAFNPTQSSTRNGTGAFNRTQTSTSHSGTGALNRTRTSTSHSGTGAFNPTQSSTRNGTGAFNPTQTSTSHNGTGAFNPTQSSTRNGTGAFNPTQSSTRNGTGAFNPTQSSTRNGTGAFNRTQTSTSHNGTGAFNRTRTSTSHSGTGAFNRTQTSTRIGTGAFNPTQTSTSRNGTGAFNLTQTSTSNSSKNAQTSSPVKAIHQSSSHGADKFPTDTNALVPAHFSLQSTGSQQTLFCGVCYPSKSASLPPRSTSQEVQCTNRLFESTQKLGSDQSCGALLHNLVRVTIKPHPSKDTLLEASRAPLKSKPRGIPNFGNTCYINAAIECLIGITDVNYFMTNDTAEASPIVKAFSQLLKKMQTNAEAAECRVDVRSLSSFFPKYSQQDAHEFLIFLLEEIFQWSGQNGRSLSDLFHGELTSEIHCPSCRKPTSRVDPFVSLSVPVPDKDSPLMECMTMMMEKTDIEGTWRCSKCSNMVPVQRQVSVSKFPEILIVHLKRFYLEGMVKMKRNTVIDFELDNLDLSMISKPPILAPKYSLIAVINHYGTMSGGHYTAYCKQGSDWYSFDDSYVSSVTDMEVVTPVAYVLFYEQKK